MKKQLSAIILFCLIVSCDITTIKFSLLSALPDISNSNCVVLIQDSISVHYEGDVKDEFGPGDKDTLIREYFTNELRHRIKKTGHFNSVKCFVSKDQYKSVDSTITVTREDKLQISEHFVASQLTVSKREPVTISLPVEGEKFTIMNTDPQFILFLSNVTINSSFKFGLGVNGGAGVSGNGFGLPSFSSSKDLIIESNFVFWDNVAKKMISYGLINAIDENKFSITKEDWDSAIDQFIGKIDKGMHGKKSNLEIHS
jgi:hypothetical protein